MRTETPHKHLHMLASRTFHSQLNGTTAIPWRSSLKKLSLLDKLKQCQQAWCPKAPWDKTGAHAALCGTPAGSFLVVRESVTFQPILLCVSAGPQNKVLDYDIKSTGKVVHLSESCLVFSDLSQLVVFYSLTRDVLPVCLFIPSWICSVNETNKERLSQLDPETWLSAQPEQNPAEMSQKELNSMMCSIQLTSTNGALCFINPLYLHEHGDDWLTQKPTNEQRSTPKQQRRLSSSRAWAGAGLQGKRAMSFNQSTASSSTETSGLVRAKSADSPVTALTQNSLQTPQTPSGVVLRRPSRDISQDLPQRASTGCLSSSSSPSTAIPEMQRHSSPVLPSPHRVSWIENGFWMPPPKPSPFLQPSSLELDSLSISSIEEEPENQIPNSTPQQVPAHRLADKVINRLSAMGQVIGGLVCQKKRLTNRVMELSEKKGGVFAEAVKSFVETMMKAGTGPNRGTESDFLQEVRLGLSSLKETLQDNQDIQILLDGLSDLNDSEIDSLLEISIHKVALKPISNHLYTCIHSYRTDDGCFERLRNNLRLLEKNSVEELGGSAGVGVPDPTSMERIQQRWTSMQETYSPNKKNQILLKICKSIYHGMSGNGSSGKVFGADDFLPCLTWVLLRGDLVTLQVDTDYMMELLDPMQLQGEGGYYLTTLYASLYYISSFRPKLAARQLSIEAQNSLNQWHRRRSLHCNQSRHSTNRRPIRRHPGQERISQKSETENDEEDSNYIDEQEDQRESRTETLPMLKEKEEDEGHKNKTEAFSPVINNESETEQ